MFIIKKKYFFYIDNIKNFDLNLIKKPSKAYVIYRNKSYIKLKTIKKIIKFRKLCKSKNIKFFIANNIRLYKNTKADGLYLSAYNKNVYKNLPLIGSAHNYREIDQKIKQGCNTIIFSRLFKTNYKMKKNFYGLVKFNLINQKNNFKLLPLGGINHSNLLKLNLVNCDGLAVLSAAKKKPVISNRLF